MMLRFTAHTPDQPMPGDLVIDPDDVEAVLEMDFVAPKIEEDKPRNRRLRRLEKRRLAVIQMRSGREYIVWDSDRDTAERVANGKRGIGEDRELSYER